MSDYLTFIITIVGIGRSFRIFPPSERSVLLSPHSAHAEFLVSISDLIAIVWRLAAYPPLS
jgi:hypothetical protein